MEFHIKVEIGLSDSLTQLANALLSRQQTQPGVLSQLLVQQPEQSITAKEDLPAVEPESAIEPKPAAQEPSEQAKKTTKADVRAAVDDMYKRLLGADWDSKEKELDKKKINRMCKQIFIQLGSVDGKMASLPEDQRDRFIEIAQSIYFDENGDPQQKVPF
jgi:hypothetical protein